MRVEDLETSAKVAMAMHKQSKKSTYYQWAVMVQYIQVSATPAKRGSVCI